MSFDIQPVRTGDDRRTSGASSLLRGDVVTIYNAIGEVDRRATYARTVLGGVCLQESSGAVASLTGSTSTDGALVIIPGSTDGYVPAEIYAGAGWTLKEGDLVVVGRCDLDIPGATIAQIEKQAEVYRIAGFEKVTIRGRLHHWEVAAK